MAFKLKYLNNSPCKKTRSQTIEKYISLHIYKLKPSKNQAPSFLLLIEVEDKEYAEVKEIFDSRVYYDNL